MKLNPKSSSISLVDYFVKKLSFEQNDKFVPECLDQVINTDLDLAFKSTPLDESKLRWTIEMSISSTSVDAIKLPYQFQIEMSATVTIRAGYLDKDLLVNVTGSSMVYGICREKIRLACSHGKYRPMLLPTLNFLPDKPKLEPTIKEAQ